MADGRAKTPTRSERYFGRLRINSFSFWPSASMFGPENNYRACSRCWRPRWRSSRHGWYAAEEYSSFSLFCAHFVPTRCSLSVSPCFVLDLQALSSGAKSSMVTRRRKRYFFLFIRCLLLDLAIIDSLNLSRLGINVVNIIRSSSSNSINKSTSL